jgi:hypothetical protein
MQTLAGKHERTPGMRVLALISSLSLKFSKINTRLIEQKEPKKFTHLVVRYFSK